MTQVLRVVLVDDEPLARMRMRALLAQALTSSEVVGEFGDAASAMSVLRQWDAQGNVPDVLFLDIALPGANGMQLARQVGGMSRVPMIVFVTAHAEHALTAFELDATDYLTKPIRLDRLNTALDRVRNRMLPNAPVRSSDDVFIVQERDRMVRIRVQDVVYFKAELKYVTLRTATQVFLIPESLSELEHRLGDQFIRVHRNALVARRSMSSLERQVGGADADTWAVQVEPTKEWLLVSRRQIGTVKEAMASHGL